MLTILLNNNISTTVNDEKKKLDWILNNMFLCIYGKNICVLVYHNRNKIRQYGVYWKEHVSAYKCFIIESPLRVEIVVLILCTILSLDPSLTPWSILSISDV